MEGKQSKLCVEILRRFHRAGILRDLTLIGSWCVFFYRDYFSGTPFIDQATIRTRDIDFLIGNPAKVRKKVDVPDLLKDLGFLVEYKGSKGYIRLDHPDLILEFLVPEKGRGEDRPYEIAQLGINATALRFLHFLTMKTIKAKVEDFSVTLPHPAVFALHKMIIYQRRTKEDKAAKDLRTALAIIRALLDKGDLRILLSVYNSIPRKWQEKIVHGLKEAGEEALVIALR